MNIEFTIICFMIIGLNANFSTIAVMPGRWLYDGGISNKTHPTIKQLLLVKKINN